MRYPPCALGLCAPKGAASRYVFVFPIVAQILHEAFSGSYPRGMLCMDADVAGLPRLGLLVSITV